MSGSHFFRYASITGKNGILNVMRHNKRSDDFVYEKNAHIDKRRSHLNYSLHDDRSPDMIAEHVRVQIAKVDATVRSNAIMGIDVLFSLPANWHGKDSLPFFIDCYEWVKKLFPVEMLSFEVHLDEAAPHAHAVFLPLLDGKLQGSYIMGDRTLLKQRQTQFSNDVASKYGLFYKANKKISTIDKRKLSRQVCNRLQKDPAVESLVWQAIRDSINNNPVPFAELLSISTPEKPIPDKNFVDIKRSKGKGVFLK